MNLGKRRQVLIRGAGGIAVGAACLWLSLRSVEGEAILAEIHHAALPYVGLAILASILVGVGKALRWQLLFPMNTPAPPFATTFGILMTGQMLNLLVPVRLGEVARVGLMRQEGLPVGSTLGTIVVEKSLDLLAIGLLVLLTLPLAALPSSLRGQLGIGGLVFAVLLILALVTVAHFRQPLLGLFRRIPAPRKPILARPHRNMLRLVQTTLDSLAVLEGPHLFPVLGLTATIWLVSVGGMVAMLSAFRLPLDFGMGLVLMLAMTTSNWAPTPPALIGVVGAVAVAVLTPFGVSQEAAVALGAVLNIVVVAPPVLLGAFAVWSRLLAMREVMAHAGWRDALGLVSRPQPGDRP